MPGAIELGSSLLASSLRGWRGSAAFRPAQRQPEQLLELYEFEACPYCRLVRETLTELDLDAMIYPCPRGGTRFRPRVRELGGRLLFPFLIDPNSDVQLYESADIVDYLRSTYGHGGTAPRGLRRGLAVAQSMAASASRATAGLRGARARASHAVERPLELYSFESSPYSRLVRERLSELELPYRLRNFGKSRWQEMGPPLVRTRLFPDAPVTGPNRMRLYALTGRMQVPYLVDPNNGAAMFESDDILRYLDQTYAA